MNKTGFWGDALRDGAILGVVMALSRVLESYLLVDLEFSLDRMSIIVFVEMIAATVAFVWLLHRFTKRRAMAAPMEEGFPYGSGLIYAFTISVLTGVIVGFASYLFIEVVGYQNYVEGYVGRIDQMGAMMPGSEALIDDLVEAVESSPKPSIFDNILASVNNYIITGTILGLIIARMVRREPQIFNKE